MVTVPVRSQVMGPMMPSKSFELGGIIKWHQYDASRQDETGGPDENGRFWDGSLFFRYGTNGWVTLSGEATFGNEARIEDNEGHYRWYTFGMGAQVRFWRRGGYLVSGGVYYNDNLGFSQNGIRCNVQHGSHSGIVQLEKSFLISKQSLTLWGGPVYYKRFQDTFPQNGCELKILETTDNWGVTAGVDMLFFDHLRADASAMYVEYFEPRVSLSWRF